MKVKQLLKNHTVIITNLLEEIEYDMPIVKFSKVASKEYDDEVRFFYKLSISQEGTAHSDQTILEIQNESLKELMKIARKKIKLLKK